MRNCISSSGRVIWKEEVPYKNYLQFHRVSLFNLCKMDSPQAQKLSIHKQFIFPGLPLPFVNLCKISRGTWSCERHFGHLRCLVNVLWMYHFLMIFAMSKGKSVFKVNNETWKNDLCDRIGFRFASENYYPWRPEKFREAVRLAKEYSWRVEERQSQILLIKSHWFVPRWKNVKVA